MARLVSSEYVVTVLDSSDEKDDVVMSMSVDVNSSTVLDSTVLEAGLELAVE